MISAASASEEEGLYDIRVIFGYGGTKLVVSNFSFCKNDLSSYVALFFNNSFTFLICVLYYLALQKQLT